MNKQRTNPMVIVYRLYDGYQGREFHHYNIWVGPFLNWPCNGFELNEFCWIVPGTVDPED